MATTNASGRRSSLKAERNLAIRPSKKHTNWLGQKKAALLKFDPKPPVAAFTAVFSNIDKCWPEYLAASYLVWLKTRSARMYVQIWWFWVKQWPNYWTLCLPHQFLYTLGHYIAAFCSRPEATSDGIAGVAVEYVGVDVHVHGDSWSNRYWDIRATHFVMDNERRMPVDASHHIRQNAILALWPKNENDRLK